MANQKKDNHIDGKLKRLLRPVYQMQDFKGTFEFPWRESDLDIKVQVEKSYKYKKFILTLDATFHNTGIWAEEFGVSVEGWKSWNKSLKIFLDCVADNFWRDYEND